MKGGLYIYREYYRVMKGEIRSFDSSSYEESGNPNRVV